MAQPTIKKEEQNNEPKPEISLKEQRIRRVSLAYYMRSDIRKAMFEFSKKRECVPRYFEGFGKRPDSFQYDSDIIELAKKGATSFHCSEEIWKDPLELTTNLTEEEFKKLRIGWDLLIDIDCPYLEYSKKGAKAIISAMKKNGIKNIGIKFSVLGETPILIKKDENISLVSIEEAIKLFKADSKLEVLSLTKDGKVTFSKIYDSLEHEDDFYEIIHEHSKIPVKATGHHSVFIFEDGNVIQKKVSELKKGDFLVTFNSKDNPLKKDIDSVNNSFKLNKNQNTNLIRNTSVKINADLMRLIGYYLSEGHITNIINQTGFTFNKNEEFYINDCVNLLKNLTNRKISIRHPNPNSTQILIHSKEWATFFENLCGKSKQKHVPSFSWNLNKELFLELLKGYLRGDAHKIGKYGLTVKSVAHQMIREFVWLCKLNGISCSLSTEKSKPHKLPQGNIFKGSFVYILKIPKSEINLEEFHRSRNKFSPYPRDRTFPITPLRKVYQQIKPKSFLKHRVEQVTLRKERANLQRIEKLLAWFKNFKSKEFTQESLEIMNRYESLMNQDIGVIKIKSLIKKSRAKVYDISVEDTESFFGNDYPILLHNSGSKGFHLIIPWKAFPENMSGKQTKEMFPVWPRLICEFIKEQSREFLEKDLYDSEDSKVLSKLKKGIKCERCNNMSEKTELIHFICPGCRTKMQNLTTSFARKRKIRCPNCQKEMQEEERVAFYKCNNCALDSRKNPENFNESYESIDIFEVLGLDVILVSPRHLFRMPYSLHEKTALASIVLTEEEIDNFDMIRDADPMKILPKNFMPDSEKNEATELLRNSLEFKPVGKVKTLEEIKNPEAEKNKNKDIGPKKFNDIVIKNLNPSMYPPTIQKMLAGMQGDGKKRALFILLSFFKSLKLSDEEITSQIEAWNAKNKEHLPPSYIKGQISWYSKQKETKMPPNFDKSYYKDIGFPPSAEELKTKNPVSWVMRKSFVNDLKSRGRA